MSRHRRTFGDSLRRDLPSPISALRDMRTRESAIFSGNGLKRAIPETRGR